MSISQSMSTALSGLTAASRMAEVVSSNLANALTDGYGRRAVDLSAQVLGKTGGGVKVDGIARLVDRGVLSDRRGAETLLEARSLTSRALGRVETAFGAAGSADSIPGRIAALEVALVNAGADPSSDIALGRVGDSLRSIATGIRDAAAAVQSERLKADQSIAQDIETLNSSLRNLEKVNSDISAATVRGYDTAGLLDQRQKIVDQIARIVPVREIDRPSGQIALVTTGGEVLIDGKARQYGFQPVNTMTGDMTLASGALAGITRDGQPIDSANGIGLLKGGTLDSALQLRDKVLPQQASALDAIAADLIGRFAGPDADPTLAPGQPGLFTDAGGLHDPLDIGGLAARLAVNAAIDPEAGGSLARLRDGLGAVTVGPVGNATRLTALGAALTGATTLAGGGISGSAAEHAGRLVAGIAGDRLRAEEAESFAGARWAALRETELGGGVDSDYEMQMLMRIEQAYAANARVISALDQMLSTLMEI